MKLVFILFSFVIGIAALADSSDPNNYFTDKKWTVDAGKQGKLFIQSKYVVEPVNKPNHLYIDLKCSKSKKKINVVKKFKYCGIDAVSVIAGKVELMLTDYNPADSRGYCTKKRKQYLKLPKCK
ncbi:MAG: hypothetical protein HRT44_00410 [Bdellovibrionales bacterium]|nr:hypothetical protein [Bdellovibrionales bacterium]NQZ17716.1 hypothetical protein [Bdellovibrionales bacterium]